MDDMFTQVIEKARCDFCPYKNKCTDKNACTSLWRENINKYEAEIRADEREKVCNELLNRQILIIDDEGNMHTVVRIKHIYELINKELKNENGN